LRSSPATSRQKCKFILATDGQPPFPLPRPALQCILRLG
jgi:hypothetical protein